MDTSHFQNRRFPRIDEATLNNSIAFAQTLIDRMSTLESNIANAGVQLQAQSPSEKQYWNSYPSADAFERSIDAIVATKASSYLMHQNCQRYVLTRTLRLALLNRLYDSLSYSIMAQVRFKQGRLRSLHLDTEAAGHPARSSLLRGAQRELQQQLQVPQHRRQLQQRREPELGQRDDRVHQGPLLPVL